MPGPLSLVTVVFEPEVPLLSLQARSLNRFVPPGDFHRIVVIDNTARGLSRLVTRSLLRAYGTWQDRVEIIRPGDLDVPLSTSGWVVQQVLKLAVHDRLATDHYLVLDAKNHWRRPSTLTDFVTADGRARGALHGYRGHALERSLVRVLAYVGIDPEPWLDAFPVTHTPVVLSVEVVRDLVTTIANRSRRPFAAEFVHADLTEFFLYNAWIIAAHGGLDGHIDGTVIRSVNVWPRDANRAGFTRAIDQARRSDAPFLSIHRKALARVDRRSAAALAGYWTELGLFRSKREALVFIVAFKMRYVWTMSLRELRSVTSRFRRAQA